MKPEVEQKVADRRAERNAKAIEDVRRFISIVRSAEFDMNIVSVTGEPSRSVIDDRLAWHLDNWRKWMHSGALKGLGAPGKSCGFVGGGYNNDFDSMCEIADDRAAEAMDAMIGGLVPVQQAAVHHRYLNAVYRFPRGNYMEALEAAYVILRAGMAGRGLV